jgi:hypothetical protein
MEVADQFHALSAFTSRKKFLETGGSVFLIDWLEGASNKRKFVTRVRIAQNRNTKFCSSGPRMPEPSSLRLCLHASAYCPPASSHNYQVLKPFLPGINNILPTDVTASLNIQTTDVCPRNQVYQKCRADINLKL